VVAELGVLCRSTQRRGESDGRHHRDHWLPPGSVAVRRYKFTYNSAVLSARGGAAAGLLYLCLILIVYYKNLQNFCKQRGSTNKFDLYIDQLIVD
jgi:hypothetical protein